MASPALFAALIDLLVESTVDYLSAQIEAGAEVLQLFDSWAGVLAEPERRRWSLEPLTRASSRRLKARHPEVPVILFPARRRRCSIAISPDRRRGRGLEPR